jgi:hypothetical protein
MPLNMKKEIRAEIKILRAARHKVNLDWTAEIKRLSREQRLIQTSLNRANRAGGKAMDKIERRILILSGRLS